jgi:PAS domain S-box-containing protein
MKKLFNNFLSQEKLHEMFYHADEVESELSFHTFVHFLNYSYDGLLLSDKDDRIFYMNDAVERISGLKNEEMLGLTTKEMQEQGFILSQSKKVLKKDPLTIIQKLKTGKEVFTTSRPVKDKDGNTLCYIATFRDLSELNELHSEHTLQRDIDYTELQELRTRFLFTEDVVTSSKEIKKVVDKTLKAAKSDATVLIIGESGVGKELFAKIIHNASHRSNKRYIQINCGALPENLIEAELFGYEKGAFTGAERAKTGLLEVANGGTVLLDEIGDLPFNVQVKLLRVLQTGEYYRIGATTTRLLNIRFIAATHRDLSAMVKNGSFREDLFYRLNVVPIHVPPLRNRKEDILPLAHHFLQNMNRKYKTNKRLDEETCKCIEKYTWPGNVRQLENVIERMLIMSDEDLIKPTVFPDEFLCDIEKDVPPYQLKKEEIIPLEELREMTEKEMIQRAINKYGSIRNASKYLNVDHSTVIRKMKKYGIRQ